MKTYKISQIENKRILGRTAFENRPDEVLCLFWAASALEVSVRSKDVWILLSSDYETSEPWISVYINGSPISRFMVEKGKEQWVCIAHNLNPEKENLISIYKDTQPMTGEALHSLFIHEVGLSDDGEFAKIKERKLKLEFIGDSITSGEGLAGGVDEQDWITQWFVGSKTYAAQVARSLDADFNVLSQCGWGLCWGWDGDRNNKMPPSYEEVCGVMWGDYQEKLGIHKKYDFGKGSDFVILNLGTNDNGAFFQPPWKQNEKGDEYKLSLVDGKAGEKEYKHIFDEAKAFLKKIRKCNPHAKIIWSWGMIKLDILPPVIQAAVDSYKAESGDKNLFTLELDAMEDVEKLPEDKGSRGHPGPKTHKLAAEKLYSFIKDLM
ncbi:MAG: SGNH/GDSL hydrolase family protein [Treponema sp.]|nr:SGNH/GDSL hydrolase family protein [Treponema sp.]